MEQWEIDAELDASEARFVESAIKEYQEKEAEKDLVYLIKGKWGIDDFEDRGRGRR